jgi:hypothetical protein
VRANANDSASKFIFPPKEEMAEKTEGGTEIVSEMSRHQRDGIVTVALAD